jgi:O-antigen/teichoic acid export membrane protein
MVLRRTSWSLIDQGVVSLGTFLASIILARQLPSLEYGVFALLLTIAFNFQLLNTWLLAYPLAVRLADAKEEERARLSTSSLVLGVVLCLPISGTIGAALLAFGRADLVFPGVAWFALWQIQQVTRRTLLADLGHREAVIGDMLASLGQVLIVGSLAAAGHLSLSTALYGMAAASAFGAIHQALQLPLIFDNLYGPRRWLLQNASLGVWSLANGFVSALRVHALFWLLAVMAGTAVVSSLQAVLNVFYLLNPVHFGLASIIPQVTARAYIQNDKVAAWRAARPYILLALPPTFVYVSFAVAAPNLLLEAFYGHGSPYLQFGHLFPPLAVFMTTLVATETIICYLLGIKGAQLALKINLIGAAAVAILIGPLLTTYGTLEGTCLALAAGDIVRLGVALTCLYRLLGGKASVKFQPTRRLDADGITSFDHGARSVHGQDDKLARSKSTV